VIFPSKNAGDSNPEIRCISSPMGLVLRQLIVNLNLAKVARDSSIWSISWTENSEYIACRSKSQYISQFPPAKPPLSKASNTFRYSARIRSCHSSTTILSKGAMPPRSMASRARIGNSHLKNSSLLLTDLIMSSEIGLMLVRR